MSETTLEEVKKEYKNLITKAEQCFRSGNKQSSREHARQALNLIETSGEKNLAKETTCSPYKSTIAHILAEQDDKSSLETLFRLTGFKPDEFLDVYKNTPLYRAIANLAKEVIDYLIEKGAAIDYKNNVCKTPMDLLEHKIKYASPENKTELENIKAKLQQSTAASTDISSSAEDTMTQLQQLSRACNDMSLLEPKQKKGCCNVA